MSTGTDEVVADVDVDTDFDERDEVEAGDEGTAEKAEGEKAPAKKKRGAIPDGYVTPIGLCKAINEKGLYTGEGELKPQAVYSYIRNAPAAHPFPEGMRLDDGRVVYKLEEGLTWWSEKNDRAATRKKNAAEKAANVKEKGETASTEATEPQGEVVEAE
jgi:hypothetical protein